MCTFVILCYIVHLLLQLGYIHIVYPVKMPKSLAVNEKEEEEMTYRKDMLCSKVPV